MVMSRLDQRQGGGYLIGSSPSAAFNANVSIGASVDTGSARWTGITVVLALALVWIGYHGLKG